jgi:hypothetical protein
MTAFILIPAVLCNVVLAIMLRSDRAAFRFALPACIILAATLVIFFAFTQPANAATQNWTVAPAGWEILRTRWEYSHAVNAVLTFVSFCLVSLAVLTAGRSPRPD